jgi:hypothetical protein
MRRSFIVLSILGGCGLFVIDKTEEGAASVSGSGGSMTSSTSVGGSGGAQASSSSSGEPVNAGCEIHSCSFPDASCVIPSGCLLNSTNVVYECTDPKDGGCPYWEPVGTWDGGLVPFDSGS